MAISPLSFFWLDDPHDLQGMPTPNRNLGPTLATYSLHSVLTGFCVSRAYERRFIGVGPDGAWRVSKKAFPCHDSGVAHELPLVSWASR